MKSLKDALFMVLAYLPAANASSYTDSLDLGSTQGDPGPSLADVEVIVPALPNHVDPTKEITLDLHDSADDLAFAETAPLIRCKVPGVAGTGSLETRFVFRLPPGVQRYIAMKQSVPAGDGDNTAGQVQFNLLF